MVDVMKILGELYLQQRGIEATVKTIPIKKEDKEKLKVSDDKTA